MNKTISYLKFWRPCVPLFPLQLTLILISTTQDYPVSSQVSLHICYLNILGEQ